ncbi:hypothetical protein NDU88_002806 [Pleurodeles waltl]|uniref:Uncharacterized protein n=1 Tax=Pleurodeles waltl TaxID=8319 RepID=A0AAV7TMZ0_PLEWA|nr:hypothetical protein NDU88_002806 [Pleurodeles waltl]
MASAVERRTLGDAPVSLAERRRSYGARRDTRPTDSGVGTLAAAGRAALPGHQEHRWIPKEGQSPLTSNPEGPLKTTRDRWTLKAWEGPHWPRSIPAAQGERPHCPRIGLGGVDVAGPGRPCVGTIGAPRNSCCTTTRGEDS